MNRCLILLLLLIACPLLSYTHRLEVDLFKKNSELIFHVTSSGDQSIQDCHLTIVNSQGKVVAEGDTNQEGCFSWVPQEIEDVTVRAYSGTGHKKNMELSADELNRWLAYNEPNSDASESINHKHESSSQHSDEIQHLHTTADERRTTERVVLGLTFLLAGWAAWCSSRNSKKLDRIQEIVNQRDRNS